MATDGSDSLPTEFGDPIEKGNEAIEEDHSVDISLSNDNGAEEERREELMAQAQKIEEEIVTLRQALNRKERQLADVKRQLGITAWTQLRDGIGHQYQNLQGTQMYSKLSSGAAATKSYLSDAGSKTATAARNVGSATAKKLGEIRDSSMFQSLENKVVSASSSLKEKMTGQKSASVDDSESKVDLGQEMEISS